MYRKILLAYDGSPDGDEALAQVESLVSSPSGTTVHLLAIIDFSENMLIVEGMAFVPDNRRYLTQRLLDAGVKRLQRVVAVKSRTINSNVTPIREDAGAA